MGFTKIRAMAMSQYGAKKEDQTMDLLSEVRDKTLVAADETATPWVGICFGLKVTPDHH